MSIEKLARAAGPAKDESGIAGPFLPEESWQSLLAAAQGRKGVQLLRSVPDLCEEMRAAAASVSQCGYNTSLDILQSSVPALVVLFATGLEDEQIQCPARLEQLGAVRLLDEREMTPQSPAPARLQSEDED